MVPVVTWAWAGSARSPARRARPVSDVLMGGSFPTPATLSGPVAMSRTAPPSAVVERPERHLEARRRGGGRRRGEPVAALFLGSFLDRARRAGRPHFGRAA